MNAVEWQNKYLEWQKFEPLTMVLKQELQELSDEQDLEDRFYRYLEFGTGGMRGELGAGTNRINEYTIKRVAVGLAKYIHNQGIAAKKSGVVIAYDNRFFSKEFAEWTARILASMDIIVYLSDSMRPTPQLSFLVRELKAFMGVMITASHNPKEYNGFKVYGADGGQITLSTANELMTLLAPITDELLIDAASLSTYLSTKQVHYFGEEMDERYLNQLETVIQATETVKKHGGELSILYTPLHGAGKQLMGHGFKQLGFSHFSILEAQADGDPAFSTVALPNPEDPKAFQLALKTAANQAVDLFLATDPDADRLGVVVLDEKQQPVLLNGNQIGVLLLDYLIHYKHSQNEDLTNYFIAKTIVTSDLGSKLATAAGIEIRNTLTGFKFIGEQITLSEEKQDKEFLFGYEESFGYLIKPFVRDKDAVQAAVLMAELALSYKLQGSSVLKRLYEIYKDYGFYKEALDSIEFKGKRAQAEMCCLIETIKQTTVETIGSKQIIAKEDYSIGTRINYLSQTSEWMDLPKSDVIKLIFADQSWIAIRPSGTEPKCKIYYSIHEESEVKAERALNEIKAAFKNQFLMKT